MINTTEQPLVLLDGNELYDAIVACHKEACEGLRDTYSFRGDSLSDITGNKNYALSYLKFVENGTLKSKKQKSAFTKDYVLDAFSIYMSPGRVMESDFKKFVLEINRDLRYNKGFSLGIKKGIGGLLILLHFRGAIVLPLRFSPPHAGLRKNGARNKHTLFLEKYPAIIAFAKQPDDIVLDLPIKLKEWFKCYGTKLVFALGWLSVEDILLDELYEFYTADISHYVSSGIQLPFSQLISLLEKKYVNEMQGYSIKWATMLDSTRAERKTGNAIAKAKTRGGLDQNARGVIIDRLRSDSFTSQINVQEYVLSVLSECILRAYRIDQLKNAEPVYGNVWLSAESWYMNKKNLESNGSIESSFSILNAYLFLYLPKWLEVSGNPLNIELPSSPNKFNGAIFQSRELSYDMEKEIKVGEDFPLTFVEYFHVLRVIRDWQPNTAFGYFNNIYLFLEMLSSRKPAHIEAGKFTSYLERGDKPRAEKLYGTNKGRVPHRAFPLLMQFVWLLEDYNKCLIEAGLEGRLTEKILKESMKTGCKVIFTNELSSVVGYVPAISTPHKTIILNTLPNVFNIKPTKVKGRKSAVMLPHPQGLRMNIFALETGIRNNHTQFLDLDTWDSMWDRDLSSEMGMLVVNTDKVGKRPRLRMVYTHNLLLLEAQSEWRNIVDDPHINQKQFYNNNPKTCYGAFRQLFADVGRSGLAISDFAYEKTWADIMCFFVSVSHQAEIGVDMGKYVSLMPKGIKRENADIKHYVMKYSDQRSGSVSFKVATDITPHSGRVTVASEYTTILPAHIVGRYITGQTPATVYHYVVLDDDQIKDYENEQKKALLDDLRENPWGKSELVNNSPMHIKAAAVNSVLSEALRQNLNETLEKHGATCLSGHDKSDDEDNGIDLLMTMGWKNAANGETEVCPYGFHCPPKIKNKNGGDMKCFKCSMAVRFIDHLPAISARIVNNKEILEQLDYELSQDQEILDKRYTYEQLEELEISRTVIAEENAHWMMCAEALESKRKKIEQGDDVSPWIVEKPEVIAKQLQRVPMPTNLTRYLISRFQQVNAYPMFENAEVRRAAEIVKRKLLAGCGKTKEAFEITISPDPVGEVIGMIRMIQESTKLSVSEIASRLDDEKQLVSEESVAVPNMGDKERGK